VTPVPEQASVTEVPFVDLAGINASLKEEILAGLSDLIDRSEFGTGAAVKEFEDSFATFCGAEECVGLSSGIDAVRLLLAAAGVAPGDGLIVPAMTFIATFAAVSQLGATPIPVDVSPDDYNLDPAAVEAAIGPGVNWLLPVHLYGQLADMAGLRAIAERHGLGVVEDACQAHGASRAGHVPGRGTVGAAFSFYPAKNLGAMGDAGAVVTNDRSIAEKVRMLRVHGQKEKNRHDLIGWTGRLDSFQAVVLTCKLSRLAEWNVERHAIATLYTELLAGVGDLVLPQVARDSEHVWHVYAVRTGDPVALADHLRARGIESGRHYPTPPHLTEAYAHLGYEPGAFPVAEELGRTELSLPIFAGMTQAQVETVASAVEEFFREG
jgi:dTDP-4-amino-4,6-dideoxygalactose transaminase